MVDTFLDDLMEEEDDAEVIRKVLSHFEDVETETENFMDILISKLPLMYITWEQPWYQQSQCLTRPLKNDVENGMESYRTDRFSKAESDIIDRNWKKFVKMYEVPDTPHYFTNYKLATKNSGTPQENVRHFVTAFLAQNLKRDLHHVHKYLLSKYSYTRKGPYNGREEILIRICVNHFPDKAFKVLSCILRREPRRLYSKVQEVKNSKEENECNEDYDDKDYENTRTYLRWTLKRSSKFLKSLLKYTGLPLNQLKNKHIEKHIWDKVAFKSKRSSDQVREYWYHRLHVQLFVEHNLKFQRLRRKIFRKLYASSYQYWSDIDWNEFAKAFPDGCTKHFIYDIACRPFHYDKHLLKKPLKEAIDFAFEKLAKFKGKNRRLKRLRLNENGKLEHC